MNSRRAAPWGWQKMLEDTGFVEVTVGPPVDTFEGAQGQDMARAYAVYGHAFLAQKPTWRPT